MGRVAHGQAEKALDRDVTLLAETHAGQRVRRNKKQEEAVLPSRKYRALLDQARRLKQNGGWEEGGV